MGSEPTDDATNTTARAKQVQKTPLAPPSEKNLRGRAGDWRRERKTRKKSYTRKTDCSSAPPPGLLEAVLLPAASLRGFGVHFFDDLRKWLPDILICLQAALQLLFAVRVHPFRLPTLYPSHGWAGIAALLRPAVVVPD